MNQNTGVWVELAKMLIPLIVKEVLGLFRGRRPSLARMKSKLRERRLEIG